MASKNSNTDWRLEVAYVAASTLKLDTSNPREHSEKQIWQIVQSIKLFGFVVCILIDANMRVIAGHGRLLAARFLGLENVPVIKLEHLSEQQRRAFMLADNKLCDNSCWNERLLGEQLEFLAKNDLDFDLSMIGFEVAEIDMLIRGLSLDNETKSDPADEIPAPAKSVVSQLGDCWRLGRHSVLCGDSLKPASYQILLEGKQATLVVSDQPYNVRINNFAVGSGKIRYREFAMASGEMSPGEFTTFLNTAMKFAAANSTPGAISFYFIDWRHIGEMLSASKDVYSSPLNLCVWTKTNPGMGSLYRSGHELILVFKNGKGPHQNNVQLGRYGRNRSNVWSYPGANSFSRSGSEGNLLALHPTSKPVALIADAIMDCSKRGDLVLDPFLGSGTTIIAAERTGRVCRGLELDPQYVDTIVRRWQAFTGQIAIHEPTGKSFAERENAVNESVQTGAKNHE